MKPNSKRYRNRLKSAMRKISQDKFTKSERWAVSNFVGGLLIVLETLRKLDRPCNFVDYYANALTGRLERVIRETINEQTSPDCPA